LLTKGFLCVYLSDQKHFPCFYLYDLLIVQYSKIAIYNIAECVLNDLERAAGAIPYNPQARVQHGYNSGPVPRTGRFDNYDASRPATGGDRRRRGSGGEGGYSSGNYSSGPRRYNQDRSSNGYNNSPASSTIPPGELDTQTISVNSDMVGCIIGKGGSFINTIRRQSGARLRISEEAEGTTQRVVTITGTKSANSRALQMIYDQLEAEKQRRMSQPADE
jgi:heterogeneous nuclear rnp K-like protein 2